MKPLLRCWCGLAAGAILLAAAVTARAGVSPSPDKALLVVKLPANATLVIGSSPTQQRGPERWFASPPLEPGKTYTYEVTAIWTDAGGERKEVKTVVVSAGKRTDVVFAATQEKGEKIGQPEPVKSRTFLFTYAALIKKLQPGATAKIWVPLAVSTPNQEVAIVKQELPAEAQQGEETQYGNKILHFEAKANADGEIPLKIIYRVTRQEVKTALTGLQGAPPLPRFLQADAKGPLEGKHLDLIKDKDLPPDPMEAAKVMYDVVNTHMKYSKEGKGWGEGDVLWACDSKFGNCSDFHALFISLARAQKIPAKFEIGFPIPEKRGQGPIGGYHCWAWFHIKDKGWIPVDISEANRHPKMRDYYFGNLTEDRVVFTTGRDIDLAPRQAGKSLNFFIYPYVEVDGRPYATADTIERTFAYEDVAAK